MLNKTLWQFSSLVAMKTSVFTLKTSVIAALFAAVIHGQPGTPHCSQVLIECVGMHLDYSAYRQCVRDYTRDGCFQ
jgi:hypothetical protein